MEDLGIWGGLVAGPSRKKPIATRVMKDRHILSDEDLIKLANSIIENTPNVTRMHVMKGTGASGERLVRLYKEGKLPKYPRPLSRSETGRLAIVKAKARGTNQFRLKGTPV